MGGLIAVSTENQKNKPFLSGSSELDFYFSVKSVKWVVEKI